MISRPRVTADDFGLTRGVSDAILQCSDAGVVDQVSMIATGEAFDYALKEFASRRSRPMIALHLNLTEGRALSEARDISHLVDERGFFRFSAARLMLAHFFALPSTRRAIEQEVEHELTLQWGRLRSGLAAHAIALDRLDGHQHVHMVPFVFRLALNLPGLKHVRIPREPFYIVPGHISAYLDLHTAIRFVLASLGTINARRARATGIQTNTYILGFLFSGRMTRESIYEGLRTIAILPAGDTEIIVHPGTARAGELRDWCLPRENTAWQFSSWRTREHDLLMSGAVRTSIDDFCASRLPLTIDISRTFRFIVSGGSAAVVNLTALYIGTEWFHLWYLYSALIAFSCSVIVSFALQKFWTFADGAIERIHVQFTIYAALQILNLMIDGVGIYVLVQLVGMWYMLAQFMMLAGIAIWTFLVFNRLVFKVPHA